MSAPKPHHYVLSDLHLGHENILSYCRPWFKSIQEHDDCIIANLKALKEHDSCWILGDVAFTKEALNRLGEVKCGLYLIGGNHDQFGAHTYLQYFKNIYGVQQLNKGGRRILFTHIPMHPDQNRWEYNLHGHLHTHHVDDSRYFNCSCEALEFKPKLISEIIEFMDERNVTDE